MKPIKIAQIGVSGFSHGDDIFATMRKFPNVFELVGYVLPENERERLYHKLGPFEGYPELTLEQVLNDPEIEAVTVETEEVYLSKYALLAARHGKHIHMEKPGGEDLGTFEKLIDAMRQSGKVFHTGYMYRYNPEVLELLKKIRAGELGQILSVEAQMNSNHSVTSRSFLGTLKGGIMFFLGCHVIDLVMQIMGKPNRIVPFNKVTGKDGLDVLDYGLAVFEYDNGVAFAKSCSSEIGGFARRQLVVSGTKGTAELKPLEMHSGSTLQTTEVRECLDPKMPWVGRGESHVSQQYERYDDMMLSFAAMVRGEKENPNTLDYELELYRTVLIASGIIKQ